MILKQFELRQLAPEYRIIREHYSVKAAAAAGRTTAFLSHSHKDKTLAEGVQVYLKKQGWDVYIDWLDEEMPEAISAATATNLQAKIMNSEFFLFLATQNSCKVSRWCPWEIGYADGKKERSKILIIPTQDDNGYQYGSEYLGLYRRIEKATPEGGGEFAAAAIPPSGKGVWIRAL